MKFMTKNRGAISIFLALILLPMMAVASVYIEASRIKSAKSVAMAAGDLTLNTALTNYDNVLKDMYGLMASSQTEDELFDNLSDYYYNSMISAGLDPANANTYVEQIMATLEKELDASEAATDNNVVDMLSMDMVGSGFTNTTDSTTSLANPVYLKSQIIDLMKYRTPLDAGLSFLASLESFTTLGAQQTVIDNKNNYYKVQQGIIGDMEEATSYLRKYDRLATETITIEGAGKVDQFTQANGGWVAFYEGVGKKLGLHLAEDTGELWLVSNNLYREQYNAQGELTSGVNKYFNIDFKYYANKGVYTDYIYMDGAQVKKENIGAYGATSHGNKITKYPSLEDIRTKEKGLKDAYNAYKIIKDADAGDSGKKLFVSSDSKDKIQWLIQYNRAIEKEGNNYPETLYKTYVAHYDLINSVRWLENAESFYILRKSQLESFKNSLTYTYDFDFAVDTINEILKLNESYGLIESAGELVANAGEGVEKTITEVNNLATQFENLITQGTDVIKDAGTGKVDPDRILTSYDNVVSFIEEVEAFAESTETTARATAKTACDELINALRATKELSVFIEGYHDSQRDVNDVNGYLGKVYDLNKYVDYKIVDAPVLEGITENPVSKEVEEAIKNINNIKALMDGETRELTVGQYCSKIKESLNRIFNPSLDTSIISMFKKQRNARDTFLTQIDKLVEEDEKKEKAITKDLDELSNLKWYKDENIKTRDIEEKYGSQLNTELLNFANLTSKSSTVYQKGIFDATYTDENKKLAEGVPADDNAKYIYDNINTWYKKLETAKNYLSKANESLGEVAAALHPDTGSLTEAEEKWSESTKEGDIKGTTIAQQNQQEISAVKDLFSYDEVVELKNVVDAKIGSIENAMTELTEYKYAGTSLKSMKNHKDYDIALNTITTHELINISLDDTKLKEDSKKLYNNVVKKPEGGFTIGWDAEANPQFYIDRECKFYVYLMNNFPNILEDNSSTIDSETSTSDNEDFEKTESTLEKAKTDNEPNDEGDRDNGGASIESLKSAEDAGFWPSADWNELKGLAISNNPPEELSKDDEESGTSITNFFSKLGTALKSATEDLRDYLLISDFVMRNFTYASYENEIRYEIADENERDKLKYMTDNLSEPVYDGSTTINEDAFCEGATKSEYYKKAINIMGQPITPAYNSDYLAEVEYIVFGNNAGTKAFATTYAIRASFNTIYAFTDSSIREGAFSMASAIFGVPPLTFLIPVAQIAIIIGIALAESAIDMARLMAGMPVPIYKDTDSWTLSFKSLLNDVFEAAKDELLDELKDEAEEFANKAVDGATSKLYKYLDMTDQEINDALADSKNEIHDLVDDVTNNIEQEIDDYIDTAMTQLTTLCQNTKSLVVLDSSGNEFVWYTNADGTEVKVTPGEYVEKKLNEWVGSHEVLGQELNVGYIAKEAAVKAIIEGDYATRILDKIDALEAEAELTVQGYAEALRNELEDVRGMVNTTVNTTCDKIIEYKDSAKAKVEDAIGKGAESIKNAISESIQGIELGGSGSSTSSLSFNNNNSSKGTFFSFQYSDYLRMYLLIGLIGNEEATLTRVADVIQANMKLASGNSSYSLDKAYTHISFDVELEVKPLFIGIPESILGKSISSSWNKFTYSGQGGY